MPQPPDDDQIQKMLDDADIDPDQLTPNQIVNRALGRDTNA